MSVQPASPKKAGKIPLPAAIGIIVVALAAVFLLVLKPMLFPAADESLPTTPAMPSPSASAPGAPAAGAPANAPGGPAPRNRFKKATIGGPAGSPAAPGAPPAVPAAPGASVPTANLTANPGEIVVKGTVKSVKSKQAVVTVTSIQLSGKPEVVLNPPHTKVVKLASVKGPKPKVNEPIVVVGKNFGIGKPLTARVVGK